MEHPGSRQPGWRSRVYTRCVYPLFEKTGFKGLNSRLVRYERLEKVPLDEARRLQWDALKRLLKHAYEFSPFYRTRFDHAGIRPSEIANPSDLKKLPPLTREDIRQNLVDIRSRRFRPDELLQAATGGTTDTPVPLLRNVESIREKNAVQWNFNRWAGYLPGDKVLYLWGARQDFSENPSWRWRMYDRHLMRRVWAPSSLFDEKTLESYRQTLNEFRPRVIYSYPTPLALFCEYLRDSGRPYHRPESAITTAEPLLAQQRQVIESTLGFSMFNHYGTRDFGLIAAECEQHQGLHVNPLAAYIEYEDIEGPGAEGLKDVIVTDLLNYGMPLIRYRINDCAYPGEAPCPCGRPYPLIRELTGRTNDVFVLPNGDRVPGVALTNRVLKVCPGIRKLQVIQDTLRDYRLRYVSGEGFASAELETLKMNLTKFFPSELRWTFEAVPDIEREPSGKTRFCISHVNSLAGLRSDSAEGTKLGPPVLGS